MIRLLSNKVAWGELSKSVKLLNALPIESSFDKFEQSYNQYLDGIKNEKYLHMPERKYLGLFPIKEFLKFPKSSVERFIKSSYEIIKSNKQANTIYNYNSVLLSYINNKIHCDVSAILEDMSNNNIQFNNYTYYFLVTLYSNQGDIDAMQNLVNVMKDNGLNIRKYTKCIIYGGYIRAKQFDRAEQFIEEENFKENDIDILIVKCKAFADIDYFKEMMETLKLISKINPDMPSMISLNLYMRLIKAMSCYSNLNQIFAMTDVKGEVDISYLIFELNRDGFYNHSLEIMLKFSEFFVSRSNNMNMIKSFSSKDCPINVYMTVLEKFSGRINSCNHLDLFSNMNFYTSLKISNKIMNVENARSIISNLLTKAINEKSIKNIEITLRLMNDKLSHRDSNAIMQYVLIPDLLMNKLISKPDEILDILPNSYNIMLSNLFMYYLCKGDLASYELLMNKHKGNKLLNYLYFPKSSTEIILYNIPFIEIKKIAVLLSKVFVPKFVNMFIAEIVRKRIIQLSNYDNVIAIKEAIEMAKNLGVTFEKENISSLVNKVPKYASLFDQLELTKELLDDHDLLSS